MAGEILYCFNIYTSKEQVGNIGMTEDVRSDIKINGINAVAMLRLLTQFGFDFEGSFDPVDIAIIYSFFCLPLGNEIPKTPKLDFRKRSFSIGLHYK